MRTLKTVAPGMRRRTARIARTMETPAASSAHDEHGEEDGQADLTIGGCSQGRHEQASSGHEGASWNRDLTGSYRRGSGGP